MPGEHPSEAKVRENARRRLALQLQDLVVKQRSAQKRYLQKMKEKQGGGQRSAVFDFLDREMGAAGGANGADIDTGFNAVQLQVRSARGSPRVRLRVTGAGRGA